MGSFGVSVSVGVIASIVAEGSCAGAVNDGTKLGIGSRVSVTTDPWHEVMSRTEAMTRRNKDGEGILEFI